MPEARSGIPSPPASPSLAFRTVVPHSTESTKQQGRAAHTITEECERLFCETLRAVFLGERDTGVQDSLVMDARLNGFSKGGRSSSTGPAAMQLGTPPDDGYLTRHCGNSVSSWLEIWEYVGGTQFRGFTAQDTKGNSSLFVFFESDVIGPDLKKQALIALLELASTSEFNCDRLIVCLDRKAQQPESKALMKDLGWIGFELTTLAPWAGSRHSTSPNWLFMSMEI